MLVWLSVLSKLVMIAFGPVDATTYYMSSDCVLCTYMYVYVFYRLIL